MKGRGSPGDDAFGTEIVRVHRMDPQAAEQRLWELYASANAEGQLEHAWMCLSQIRMLFEGEGRRRDALRISIRLVREHRTVYTLVWFANALERYGWLRWARRFFERALAAPDEPTPPPTSSSWHDIARAGLMRLELRTRKDSDHTRRGDSGNRR